MKNSRDCCGLRGLFIIHAEGRIYHTFPQKNFGTLHKVNYMFLEVMHASLVENVVWDSLDQTRVAVVQGGFGLDRFLGILRACYDYHLVSLSPLYFILVYLHFYICAYMLYAQRLDLPNFQEQKGDFD
ncbi:hypothetical protein ACJX0J_034150 [Zea mays]